MDIAVASPKGYECDSRIVEEAKEDAKASGANILLTEDPEEAIKDADVVYTDTWVSMGQESEKEERIKVFMPYQVTTRCSQKPMRMQYSCIVYPHTGVMK